MIVTAQEFYETFRSVTASLAPQLNWGGRGQRTASMSHLYKPMANNLKLNSRENYCSISSVLYELNPYQPCVAIAYRDYAARISEKLHRFALIRCRLKVLVTCCGDIDHHILRRRDELNAAASCGDQLLIIMTPEKEWPDGLADGQPIDWQGHLWSARGLRQI